MRRRIVAVIVLYHTLAEESVSYRSLLRAAQQIPAGELDLLVVLHDNTPGSAAPGGLPRNVVFCANATNSGLATAYNRALTIALEGGYEWLFTLDQDTRLPEDALRILMRTLTEIDQRPDVAAVVPQIRAAGRIVSPNYFAGGAWPRWFPPGFTGIPEKTVYAFNSGSLLRTAALRQCGGYSPWFWLDNSDSFLYRQLSKLGKRVYIAGALEVDHDFSMLNMRERMSPARYRTVLLAESAFWDLEMNPVAGFERTARLAGRLCKHLLRNDNAQLFRLTFQALLLRIFRSRRYRIARWRKATAERLDTSFHGWSPPRAKVSVCMAAYNGERFVNAQLRSILPQLVSGDEIMIVDDASSDGTLEQIRQLQHEAEGDPGAPRILLLEHRTNRGVVRTFEDALRSATGDILFLCDDDDLWAPDRVRKVLEVFAGHRATQLVSTGLTLIDENDQSTSDAEFLSNRHFTANLAANFLHNQFQGSAMAFRSTLLHAVLPIPANRLFLHDAWIGAWNSLAGGGTAYIDQPLLLYRRHARNYTRRLGGWKQVQRRLQLLAALLLRAAHRC